VRSAAAALWIAFALTPYAARASTTSDDARASHAIEAGRFVLQSNAWVNLHQRLLYEAQFGPVPESPFRGAGQAQWTRAVDAYRAHFGKRNPIFDAELTGLDDALAHVDGWILPGSLPDAPARILWEAMPLYRAQQWPQDDRANRAWIGQVRPLLQSAGEELAAAHARVYAVAFPRYVFVDVTATAWEFGSYAVGDGANVHAVIASTVAGNQGHAALEMVMHEASHAIVDADTGTIGGDIARISRELRMRAPHNLWHALLFYTSGELTARALAKRGVDHYRPVITDLYAGPFRGFRAPLETHWQAYLDGRLTREEAIRRILVEMRAAGR
jgi:hypothetical protein